jgi:hypothetical protein
MKDISTSLARMRVHKDNIYHSFIYLFHDKHMIINIIYITLIPSACSKVLTWERLQSSVNSTVHLSRDAARVKIHL